MSRRIILTILAIMPGFFLATIGLTAEDRAWQLATQFMEIGNPDQAITEYQRFIFFNPADERVSTAYANIARALQAQQKWSEAIKAWQNAIASARDDSIKDERKLALAILLLASGQQSNAEFELIRLRHYSETASIKTRARFFLGLAYLYNFNWPSARTELNGFFAATTPAHISGLDSAFAGLTTLRSKSPRLARWLSIFVPGAGQIYVGDYRNGLNALGLNGILSFLLVKSIYDGRMDDALIGYLTLLQRYYEGNLYQAQKAAIDFNNHENRKFGQKILDFLSGATAEDR